MRARGLQRAGHLGNAPPNRPSPKRLEHGLASARRRRCKVSLVLVPRHIMPEPGATLVRRRPAPRHHSPQSGVAGDGQRQSFRSSWPHPHNRPHVFQGLLLTILSPEGI